MDRESAPVALVTGSTNNVGKSIAEGLARDGHRVIVTSRHGDEAASVAASLARPGDSYEIDFSDAEQITALFDYIGNEHARLDVLVNNVAYTLNESILECSLETWDRTIDTNLRSYFLCTRFAAELMRANGGGSIVNITISRLRGANGKFAYSVSKGGVAMLTMSAAVDLAPFNIRVNSVGIGPTGTAVGLKDYPDRTRAYELPRVPAGHIGDPDDVAHAVSFLVSDRARYIYGTNLNVDGGANIAR